MAAQVPLPNRNARPPAPQRPRPRKPPKPKLPKGWRGTWKVAPKLDPEKWKVGKVGKGPFKGKWVAKPVTPKPAAAAAAPAPPPNPYAGSPDAALLAKYADQPWAQNIIRSIRADQSHHEGYVGQTVLPWASGALTGLANINKAAQDSFTGQTNAAAQGLAQAAGATPGMVSGVSGGAVASPSAYLQDASAQAMANRASTMGQTAAWQGLMGTLQPTTYSQGYIASLSDYAKGLPELYARKRGEAIDSIDKYLAEVEMENQKIALQQAQMEETARHNRVQESISATNAQTNAAIQFGRLGIDASTAAFKMQGEAGEPMPTSVPVGYTVVPNDDGGWRVVRDPTVPAARAPSSGGAGGGGRAPSPARGEYPPNKLKKEGFKRLPAGAGARYRKNAVRATDGTLWYKPGKSSKSGKPAEPANKNARPEGDLAVELAEKYNGKTDVLGSGTPGWVQVYRGDPKKVATAVLSWIVKNKASFSRPNGKVDISAITRVLDTLGGPAQANTTRRVLQILATRVSRDGKLV